MGSPLRTVAVVLAVAGVACGDGGSGPAPAPPPSEPAQPGATPPPNPPAPQPPEPGALSTVSVTLAGDGDGVVRSDPPGVDCPPTCTAALQGASVTLSASTAAESTFAGWAGACSGVDGPECRLQLGGAPLAVTAQFVRASAGTGWRVAELHHPSAQLVAVDLNARGDVVGVAIAEGSPTRPFLYDGASGTTEILPLDELRPVALGDARAIAFVSTDGSRAYRYDDGTLRDLGAGLQPVDVGPQGWIVGFLQAGDGRTHGFAEGDGELRVLEGLPPDDQSWAWAVNADEIVVGTSDQRAVRLTTTGRAVDLGPAPVAFARDVSDTGLVVGSAGRTGKWPPHGFVKDLTTGDVALVDPPPGHAGVSFERVNAAGAVIATVFGGPDEGPMLWSSDGFRRVQDLAPDLGWTVTGAPEINDAGQVLIVGHGADSLRRSAILSPPPGGG
jgi:hypothetical protein